jgi:hypothetical protein
MNLRSNECALRGAATSTCESVALRIVSHGYIPRGHPVQSPLPKGYYAGNAEGVRLQGPNFITLILLPVQTSYRRVSRCSPVAFDFPLELGQADAETRPRCPETPPRQTLAIDNPLWLHNSDPLTASGQFMLFDVHKSAACGYSIT